MIIRKLESLPTVIEIEAPRGIIGVVHADVPTGMSWQTLVDSLDNPQIEEIALWGRSRIKKHFREGVSGAWRVRTRHTWIPVPLRLGNVLALDCTGGGDGPLGIYCVQGDTIYVEGRPVSLDQTEVLTARLAELEQKLDSLKTMLGANKHLESHDLSVEAEILAKRANTAWLTLHSEVVEAQRFTNALHGLGLMGGERPLAKLEELKARYAGTQILGLLERLFS